MATLLAPYNTDSASSIELKLYLDFASLDNLGVSFFFFYDFNLIFLQHLKPQTTLADLCYSPVFPAFETALSKAVRLGPLSPTDTAHTLGC